MGGNGFNRRGFIKGLMGSAFAVGSGGLVERAEACGGGLRHSPGYNGALQARPAIRAPKGTEAFWREVSRASVLSYDYFHMNTGTTGTQPLFSQNNIGVYNYYKSADPKDWESNLANDYPNLFQVSSTLIGNTGFPARQKIIADAYGANSTEIIMTYNTTDGMNMIFSGIPWQEGDRIVTTNMEHYAMIGPMAWARDYRKVQLSIVDIPSNFTADITPDMVADWFDTALSEYTGGGTQYVCISEVFYKNGLRMPIQQICQIARQHNAFTIVDTAHGFGHLPVNCHAYEADFISGGGHKWLGGGPGTGILYIRNTGTYPLPEFALGNWQLYGDQYTNPSWNYNTRNYSLVQGVSGTPNMMMQLRGENNYPAIYAMVDTLGFHTSIGIKTIYNRCVALSDYLRAKVVSQWGPKALWVKQGIDNSFKTGFTAFNPFAGKDSSDQYSTMYSAINSVLTSLANGTPKIYIRSTEWHDTQNSSSDDRVSFRISTHAMYVNYDQIDCMFELLIKAVHAAAKTYGLTQLKP